MSFCLKSFCLINPSNSSGIKGINLWNFESSSLPLLTIMWKIVQGRAVPTVRSEEPVNITLHAYDAKPVNSQLGL